VLLVGVIGRVGALVGCVDEDVGAVDVGTVDVDAVDVGPWWGCLAGRSFLDGRRRNNKKSTTTQLE
jgi:hypothetical protein